MAYAFLQLRKKIVVGSEEMKIAFATWNNRIAPVFDVARWIHLVETQSGAIINQTQARVADEMLAPKALRLAELNVDTLICGAISNPLRRMIAAYGIQVVPFVSGDLQEVIQAWLNGELVNSVAFAMPGCRDKHIRFA